MNFDEQDDFAALNKEIWDYVGSANDEEIATNMDAAMIQTVPQIWKKTVRQRSHLENCVEHTFAIVPYEKDEELETNHVQTVVPVQEDDANLTGSSIFLNTNPLWKP